MLKKIHLELKWSINYGIAYLLWVILEKSCGLHDERIGSYSLYTNVFLLVTVALYFMALLDKRKQVYQGEMTQTKGFLSGLVLTFFIGLLTPFLIRISLQYITPDFFTHLKENMLATKKMTAEQVALFYNYKSYLLQTLFLNFSLGILCSAIFSFVLANKKPTSDVQ
ncbi:MAG: DUF4199 domain-containing protein [Flavobacterium sp.]|nr:DUF4199 domain-containing protein [Flavobacterium sp.]